MNQSHLDDELLSAFLDDELEAADRARVQAALDQDAGARLRLERMRMADSRLRREIPVRPASPIDPVAQYILNAESGAHASRPLLRRRPALIALAASLAGVMLGFLLARSADPGAAGAMLASGALQRLLEQQASGEAVSAGEEKLSVLMTLRSAGGQICRLYTAERPQGGGEGLACRQEDGWHVLAWDATTGNSSNFRTAAASPWLDAAMDRLEADPLTVAQERDLLSRGWHDAR